MPARWTGGGLLKVVCALLLQGAAPQSGGARMPGSFPAPTTQVVRSYLSEQILRLGRLPRTQVNAVHWCSVRRCTTVTCLPASGISGLCGEWAIFLVAQTTLCPKVASN